MNRTSYGIMFTALIIVVLIWFNFLPIVHRFFPDLTAIDKSGQLGDSYGTLNSLFSALTLVGVLTAVYLQHKELEEARVGLADSEKHNAETMLIMKEQADAAHYSSYLNALLALEQFDLTIRSPISTITAYRQIAEVVTELEKRVSVQLGEGFKASNRKELLITQLESAVTDFNKQTIHFLSSPSKYDYLIEHLDIFRSRLTANRKLLAEYRELPDNPLFDLMNDLNELITSHLGEESEMDRKTNVYNLSDNILDAVKGKLHRLKSQPDCQ